VFDAGLCGETNVSVEATSTGATVSYSSNVEIGGFQFTVSGVTLTGATSDIGDTQFSNESGVVLGFSFTGATLPQGSGVLAELTFNEVAGGTTLLLNEIVISSSTAEPPQSPAQSASSQPGTSADALSLDASVCPFDDDITISFNKRVVPPATSLKVSSASTPLPWGSVAPVNEKPKTTPDSLLN
jgi:hypothetical protein